MCYIIYVKTKGENMIDLQTLTNKWYTIEELTEVFGTQKILSSKKVQYHALKSIGHGDLWHNGRHNHIWIQDLINCVSNGLITIGGQGKRQPDLYGTVNGVKVRIEHKGFIKEESIRVSASKFFAANGGMTQLAECKTHKERVKLILGHYTDDYYLLTKTNGEAMKKVKDVNEILVYLIKTTDMVPLLKDSRSVPHSILDLSEAK